MANPAFYRNPSADQREFIEALSGLGATSADRAVSLDNRPHKKTPANPGVVFDLSLLVSGSSPVSGIIQNRTVRSCSRCNCYVASGGNGIHPAAKERYAGPGNGVRRGSGVPRAQIIESSRESRECACAFVRHGSAEGKLRSRRSILCI